MQIFQKTKLASDVYWTARFMLFEKGEKKEIFSIWRNALTARILEQKARALAESGQITKKWLFGSRGQEGEQATIGTLLEDGDKLIVPYRGFASFVSRGVSVERIVTEVLGKHTESTLGVYPSMNFIDTDRGVYPLSNILGLDFGSVIGMGFALKMQKKGIAAILFGDGTATRGPLWSALNIASLHSLPIAFICENNHQAISMGSNIIKTGSFANAARPHGLFSVRVSATKPIEMYVKIKSVMDMVRHKRRPVFIEVETVLLDTHDYFFAMEQSEFSKQKSESLSKKDFIAHVARILVETKTYTAAELESVQEGIVGTVDRIVKEQGKLSEISLSTLQKVWLSK